MQNLLVLVLLLSICLSPVYGMGGSFVVDEALSSPDTLTAEREAFLIDSLCDCHDEKDKDKALEEDVALLEEDEDNDVDGSSGGSGSIGETSSQNTTKKKVRTYRNKRGLRQLFPKRTRPLVGKTGKRKGWLFKCPSFKKGRKK